jgi:hypothetical protein
MQADSFCQQTTCNEQFNVLQYAAGFAAHIRGVELTPDRESPWQQGWLDAYELGTLAPLCWFRQEAEV